MKKLLFALFFIQSITNYLISSHPDYDKSLDDYSLSALFEEKSKCNEKCYPSKSNSWHFQYSNKITWKNVPSQQSNNKTWKDVPNKVRVPAPFGFHPLFIPDPQEKYDWLQKYLKPRYYHRSSGLSHNPMHDELTPMAPYNIFDCYHAYMESKKDNVTKHKELSKLAYDLKSYLQCPYISQYSKEDQNYIKIIGKHINKQIRNHHNSIRQKEDNDTLYANFHMLILNIKLLQDVKEAAHDSFQLNKRKERDALSIQEEENFTEVNPTKN